MSHRSNKLVPLLLLFLPCAIHGQTMTNFIDAFPTNSYPNGSITNQWSNWFGGAFRSLSFDASSDADGDASSGSLKIVTDYPDPADQFTVWNGADGIPPGLNGLQFTNFQCDIRFAPGSASNVYGRYGTLQFGATTPTYGQSYFGSVSVRTDNTNWVHVSMTVDATSNTQSARLRAKLHIRAITL